MEVRDYRIFNLHTKKFDYPLPLILSALEQLVHSTFFIQLDLRSAYNLIRIKAGDEWKTAFITPSGHFKYLVMPFRLVNAPAIFQSYMNKIFRDVLGRYTIVYIDDILIFSRHRAEHVRHVTEVLQRLWKHHLYVKLEKCQFHQSSIFFLWYLISHNNIEMDQAKMEAVRNWSLSTTVKELQRFLSFCQLL